LPDRLCPAFKCAEPAHLAHKPYWGGGACLAHLGQMFGNPNISS